MGNIILAAYFAALLFFSFFGTHVAALAYLWFSFLLPQQILYNSIPFGLTEPFAWIAICLWLFGLRREHPPSDGIFILFLIFYAWCAFNSTLAVFPDEALHRLWKFTKIALIVIVVASVINTRQRLHALAWILVLGFGFHGFKGGIWTVVTGGGGTVLGPGSYFLSENEVARVFLVVVGLSYYLWHQSASPLARWLAFAVGSTNALAVVGTGSRGGFVALAAMFSYFALRSRYRLRFLIGGATILALVIAIAPAERLEGLIGRQQTIVEYNTDTSFDMRRAAWQYALNIFYASPINGGGFGIFLGNIDSSGIKKEAHSSYFEVLAEQGIVGFALWSTIHLLVFFRCWRIEQSYKNVNSKKWGADLALALQLCLIGHLVGGVVKNHAYFEPFYLYLAMVVQLTAILAASHSCGTSSTLTVLPRGKSPSRNAVE